MLGALHVIDFINAALYVLENGCKWRALPERFGKWYTVYARFRRWSRKTRSAQKGDPNRRLNWLVTKKPKKLGNFTLVFARKPINSLNSLTESPDFACEESPDLV